MEVVLALDIRPRAYRDGRDIIEWYARTEYLFDFTDAFSTTGGTMTFNKNTRLYEIRFSPNENWPREREKQEDAVAVYLETPDDDGNYPLYGQSVQARLISVAAKETARHR